MYNMQIQTLRMILILMMINQVATNSKINKNSSKQEESNTDSDDDIPFNSKKKHQILTITTKLPQENDQYHL